jgi:hypothetical protein
MSAQRFAGHTAAEYDGWSQSELIRECHRIERARRKLAREVAPCRGAVDAIRFALNLHVEDPDGYEPELVVDQVKRALKCVPAPSSTETTGADDGE